MNCMECFTNVTGITGKLCNKCPKWQVEQNCSSSDSFNAISGFTSNSRAPGGPVTDTQKPQIRLKGDAKEALKDYYDTVHTLCKVQTNFMASTKVLEEKLEDKAVFLDIIKQVQLPAVQVSIRTTAEIEKMEGKTYRKLTLLKHLPDYRKIDLNATEPTRTMVTFMYHVLYEQITRLRC